MTRVTITMPEDTRRRVQRAAEREGKSFSAKVTELIEEQLVAKNRVSPFEALIGAWRDPGFPPASEMEEELKEHWADAIARDRG